MCTCCVHLGFLTYVRVRMRRTVCATLYLDVVVRNRVETLHATNVMNVAMNTLVTCGTLCMNSRVFECVRDVRVLDVMYTVCVGCDLRMVLELVQRHCV
jgi:hypothetical protein